jgi:hypothetical protein
MNVPIRFELNGRPQRMAAMLIFAAAAGNASGPVQATEQIAAQTGVPCAKCHDLAAGDMRLTRFGKAFVANGFKLPKNSPKPPRDDSKPPTSGTPSPK